MTYEEIYHAATRLWFDSGVERHGEGHPGIPGPSSDDTEWDQNRAYLEGAIATLQLILERKYGVKQQDPLRLVRDILKDAKDRVIRLPWQESPLPPRTLEFWSTGTAEPYTYDKEIWDGFFPNTHSGICAKDGVWTFYSLNP